MSKQANNTPVIIKKYANRRLYNTQTSCYITQDDVFTLIKSGEDFKVVDAKTEEDLTRAVLIQIIFDQEAKGYNLLPINFLKQLVQLYHNEAIGKLIPEYLEMTLGNFLKNQDELYRLSTQGWQEFTPFKVFENITQQNMEVFQNTLRMFTPGEK